MKKVKVKVNQALIHYSIVEGKQVIEKQIIFNNARIGIKKAENELRKTNNTAFVTSKDIITKFYECDLNKFLSIANEINESEEN